MNRTTRITLGTVGLAVAAPLLALAALPGGASATTTDAARTTAERQTGLVLECAGDHVQAFVYENSVHGSSLQVVLHGRDGETIGAVEQAAPFVADGVLHAVADVEGTEVTIDGTVATDGRPAKVVEPLQDGGEQVVTRGTNTPLAADLVLRYEHSEFPLTCDPAFAFDLDVRRTTLYGG